MTKPTPKAKTQKRELARKAAEAGERLCTIAKRLELAPSTLARWAKADGFRASDIARRRAEKAQALAKADAIRAAAEAELDAALENAAPLRDGEAAETPSEAELELDKARARVGALLEQGMVKEAEADMREARRLQNLAKFAAPVQERIAVITSQADEYEIRENLIRIAFQVSEAWHKDLRLPKAPSPRISAMFHRRMIITRDVISALFEIEPTEEMIAFIYVQAGEGWFVGFREKVRGILPELSAAGHHHLVAEAQDWLEEEGRAIIQTAEARKKAGLAMPVM